MISTPFQAAPTTPRTWIMSLICSGRLSRPGPRTWSSTPGRSPHTWASPAPRQAEWRHFPLRVDRPTGRWAASWQPDDARAASRRRSCWPRLVRFPPPVVAPAGSIPHDRPEIVTGIMTIGRYRRDASIMINDGADAQAEVVPVDPLGSLHRARAVQPCAWSKSCGSAARRGAQTRPPVGSPAPRVWGPWRPCGAPMNWCLCRPRMAAVPSKPTWQP